MDPPLLGRGGCPVVERQLDNVEEIGTNHRHGQAETVALVQFAAKPRSQRLATKGLVLASLKDSSLQIVDARSEGEFCGADKRKNKRAGAIPRPSTWNGST